MAHITSANDPVRSTAPVAWLRRWPYATGSLIAAAIWLATIGILAVAVPAAPPAIGMIGYLAGVVIGTQPTGLEGPARWVVVPVITLILGGLIGAGLVMAIGSLRLF